MKSLRIGHLHTVTFASNVSRNFSSSARIFKTSSSPDRLTSMVSAFFAIGYRRMASVSSSSPEAGSSYPTYRIITREQLQVAHRQELMFFEQRRLRRRVSDKIFACYILVQACQLSALPYISRFLNRLE